MNWATELRARLIRLARLDKHKGLSRKAARAYVEGRNDAIAFVEDQIADLEESA